MKYTDSMRHATAAFRYTWAILAVVIALMACAGLWAQDVQVNHITGILHSGMTITVTPDLDGNWLTTGASFNITDNDTGNIDAYKLSGLEIAQAIRGWRAWHGGRTAISVNNGGHITCGPAHPCSATTSEDFSLKGVTCASSDADYLKAHPCASIVPTMPLVKDANGKYNLKGTK